MSFTYPSEESCQARCLHLYIGRFSKRPILRWPTPTPHPPLWLLFWPSPYPFPPPPPPPLFLEQCFGFAYRPDHDVVQNCYVVVSQEESSQYFASPCPLAIEGVWIEISLQQFLWQCTLLLGAATPPMIAILHPSPPPPPSPGPTQIGDFNMLLNPKSCPRKHVF